MTDRKPILSDSDIMWPIVAIKIKNFDSLGTTPIRRAALSIAEAGLLAIDTEKVIRDKVEYRGGTVFIGGAPFRMNQKGRIFIFGAGKCANEAARAVEEVIGPSVFGGIVIDTNCPLENEAGAILCLKGTHPFPSETNAVATSKMLEALKDLREDDLAIFVISGGGSALLCAPHEGGSPVEEGLILRALFDAGADIFEINTVRKHLSLARGGHLARLAHPARVVSLIFSDVPGDDVGFVASGPTIRDETTLAEAENVLRKYDTLGRCGLKKCRMAETPKEDKHFEKTTNILAVSNKTALLAMEKEARSIGFNPEIIDSKIGGEAREAGEAIIGRLRTASSRSAHLYGGETVVSGGCSGRGGRNMELTLSSLRHIAGGEIVLAMASDGKDNSEYAGGLADSSGRKKAQNLGLSLNSFLASHNSAPFFEQTGDYLYTNDTGSNVSDLIISLKE